jgi:hypothetical protein
MGDKGEERIVVATPVALLEAMLDTVQSHYSDAFVQHIYKSIILI